MFQLNYMSHVDVLQMHIMLPYNADRCYRSVFEVEKQKYCPVCPDTGGEKKNSIMPLEFSAWKINNLKKQRIILIFFL